MVWALVLFAFLGFSLAREIEHLEGAISIMSCPRLAPRSSPPANARDIRPDDIKAVAALGDSIMAAAFAEGLLYNDSSNTFLLWEFRGVSFGGGGEENAMTIPNFIKYYNPASVGGAVGSHGARFCYGLFCSKHEFVPEVDNLNAALSGAWAMDLKHELDYLIPRMKATPGLDFKNDWKLITIQIGSNDLCASCIDEFLPVLTAKRFGHHVDKAIDEIRKKIPKVLVHIVGTFNVTQIYPLTEREGYCQPLKPSSFEFNDIECPCAMHKDYRNSIDMLSAEYEKQLAAIYTKYSKMTGDNFGIMYTPVPLNMLDWPMYALSEFDCYHPSTLGHGWIAKVVYNSMFRTQAEKYKHISWPDGDTVFCANESDRFQLD